MSFDLEKLQAVAELGEVIRLQNEALERLAAFRKARPYLIMPNLAKMVEENIKENLQVLYKELNNLHKPAEEQTRYICRECKMAFIVKLPGGVCDECRVRLSTQPRKYVVPEMREEDNLPEESQEAIEAPAENAQLNDEDAVEAIAEDVEKATAGDKEPVDSTQVETPDEATAPSDDDTTSDEFEKFMAMAGGTQATAGTSADSDQGSDDTSETGADDPAPPSEQSDTADDNKLT